MPTLGQSGGQVVSVLAFDSDDLSSNPDEVCKLFLNNENKQKDGHFLKNSAVT